MTTAEYAEDAEFLGSKVINFGKRYLKPPSEEKTRQKLDEPFA